MAEGNEPELPSPLSEVRSVLVPNENSESDRWRAIFEQQNANMRALIEALQTPKTNFPVDLPEFDPDKANTDARSWCATADLCLAENPLHGGQLVLAISKALKGAASTWLSHIVYPGITWTEFKNLFATRFVSTETLAGTLINLAGDKPNDEETLAAYASRLMTSIMNRWKDADKQKIAVATVLAHISQCDLRLQSLAFTTAITSRDRLQQELHDFSHLKRHKRSECQNKAMEGVQRQGRHTTQATTSQAAPRPAVRPLVCFKCGKPGHIALRCTNSGGQEDGAGPARNERRVDVCVVQSPLGTLEHKGVHSFRHDYCFANETGGSFKFYPMPLKWEDAALRCYHEGAILASPLTEVMRLALSELMLVEGLKEDTVIFTGISNTYHRTEYYSMEGIPISMIPLKWTSEPKVSTSEHYCIVMDMYGSVTAVSCTESHGFVCYKKEEVRELNECGTTDPGFVMNNQTGSCYKVSRELADWPDAFKSCAIQGAHLAVINSDVEGKVIVDLARKTFAEFPNISRWKLVFVGFRSWGPKQDWITIHGESLQAAGYSKWYPGEPNNGVGKQLCGIVNIQGSPETGLFHDDPCVSFPLQYVCEIDPKLYDKAIAPKKAAGISKTV